MSRPLMQRDTRRHEERGEDVTMASGLILIVEDNPKNLKLIRDVLQFRGHTTLEAETGEAGVELARTQRPALILMDVQLPGMDGRTVAKELKADAKTQHIPIIAMTAFAMKGDRESLLADGFDGYVSKPIDIKEVVKMVEEYLAG
jgi:two-component system cell cycle response regulator DivK